MTWLFRPDGTIQEVEGWPSPGGGSIHDIPDGTWAYPSPFSKSWGLAYGPEWQFPSIDKVPKEYLAYMLLLE